MAGGPQDTRVPGAGGPGLIDGLTAHAGAQFDRDRVYRYRLWRIWQFSLPYVLWVMCNPSTADERVLDPTIRRCVAFTKAWGYGGVRVCNLFALRSTNPKALYTVTDPVGPLNDAALEVEAKNAGLVIGAWGRIGLKPPLKYRELEVLELLRSIRPVHCLKMTEDRKHPVHPLYQPGDSTPTRLLRVGEA